MNINIIFWQIINKIVNNRSFFKLYLIFLIKIKKNLMKILHLLIIMINLNILINTNIIESIYLCFFIYKYKTKKLKKT